MLLSSFQAFLTVSFDLLYHSKRKEAYRRFLAGEDNALERVIDLYKDSLIFFLMQYVKGMDIAEELTEDTFVALAVKRPLFRENAKFRTWLFTIARNKALNYLHSAAFRRNVPIDEAEEVFLPGSPEQRLLEQERYRSLYGAMSRLSANQREMIWLVYFEDMSISQAANIIHKTQRQGNSILFRARQNLKAILEKEGFEYENKS